MWLNAEIRPRLPVSINPRAIYLIVVQHRLVVGRERSRALHADGKPGIKLQTCPRIGQFRRMVDLVKLTGQGHDVLVVIAEGQYDILQVPRAGQPRRVLKSSVAPAPGPRHRRFLRGVLRILGPFVKIEPEILYINVERKLRP